MEQSALGGAAYGMLLVLGLAMGLVGGFTHAWHLGQIPIASVVWVLLLFGICWGAGLMMRSKLGAGLVAVGWLLVSMAFSLKWAAGDLVIAGDLAGYLYLYGGAVAVVVAFLLAPSSPASGSWLLYGQQSKNPAQDM
ncbi:DUF6113 family protein [Nonomuraea endophytica]|uniref:Surface polysaccharide O-acyltransferase-like enzyme n=1 Tax=Nonomuraea endophytica TaxID=714136 RepID=A0A7W8A7B7_9ACTN|nr:DUF6113 family protein [Nonomuraea endophytica]MBB5080942.1 surface polysaccharide O-acyltransferase-like enzyme [Nonomuraea endophytica]